MIALGVTLSLMGGASFVVLVALALRLAVADTVPSSRFAREIWPIWIAAACFVILPVVGIYLIMSPK